MHGFYVNIDNGRIDLDGLDAWEDNIRRLIRYFKLPHILINDECSLFNADYFELLSWFELHQEEVLSQKQQSKGKGWNVIAGNA